MKNKKTPFINIKEREYFQNVINKRLWKHNCSGLSDTSHKTSEIFLQPLVSLTTGDFSVSLSKEEMLDSAIMGAVDFLPVSVYSVILPPGFSFCIVDKKSRVLFHSSNDRNLTEIFLDENEKPGFINAAITARSKELFNSDYWGKTYRMMISPINGLPWNIVVMFEKDLLRRNNLETASVSFFLYFIYVTPFIVLLLLFLIIKGSSRNWVWPVSEYEPLYKKLLIYFILSSLVLLAFYFFSKDQTVIFFTAWLFPHSALIFTGLVIILKIQNSFQDPKRILQFSVLVLILDILLVFIISVLILKASLSALIFPMIIWILTNLAGLFILFEFPSKTEKMQNKKANNIIGFFREFVRDKKSMNQTINWYGIAITAFLIIGSVLPAAGFFIITCESQFRSYLKQAQLNYFEKIEERKEHINNYYSESMFLNSEELKADRFKYPKDIYFSSFYNSGVKKDVFFQIEPAVTWFDTSIVHAIIPQIGKAGIFPKVLSYNSADNYYAWYTSYNDSSSHLILKPYNYAENDSLIFISSLPRLSKIFSEVGAGFWFFLPIIIAGCILIFYSVIHYVLTNAFLINADSLQYSKNYKLLNENLKQNILILSNNRNAAGEISKGLNKTLINVPDFIKERYNQESKKTEWMIVPEAIPDITGSIVIINNFEYGFSNPDINNLKLSAIEDMIYTRRNKIIIISSVHPLGGFTFADKEADKEKRQNIFNKWNDILTGFISTTVYCENSIENFLVNNQDKEAKLSFPEFINALLKPSYSPGYFINHELRNKEVKIFHPDIELIADELTEIVRDKNLNSYHLFDLAMDRTRTYNQFLWDSCSMDERLVLVRLAQDRFVPVSNISSVEALLRRGILKRDPNIKPYNTLFTHFILEVNHPEEVYWDEQVSHSGWNKFKVPILIILAAIAAFLFYTQSELYNNTLAIITAVSALIPALLRFFGIFQTRQLMNKESD